MFVATMESESLSWVALGNTENEAKYALAKRWNERQMHLVQNGIIDEPWLIGNPKHLEEEYGINIWQLEPGECKIEVEL